MPENNRQLFYTKEKALKWGSTPVPALSARTAALVRPVAVARTDLEADNLITADTKGLDQLKQRTLTGVARKIRLDRFTSAVPVGQQGIAEVIEAGPDVKALRRGQLVVLPAQLGCAECRHCRSGMTAYCEDTDLRLGFGSLRTPSPQGGLLCDVLCVINANFNLVPLPESLDPIDLSSVGGDLVQAWCSIVDNLPQAAAARVLVQGGTARSAGLYAVALLMSLRGTRAEHAGIEVLDYIDTSAERVGLAEQLGANIQTTLSRALHNTYDLIVCAHSEPGIVRKLVDLLALGGKLVLVQPNLHSSVMAAEKIPIYKLYLKSASLITAMPNVLANLRHLLEHIEKSRPNLGVINTHVAGFAEAESHFSKNTTKVVMQRERLYTN